MNNNDGSPPPCKQCGGPQGWLFQTAFCKRDCDRGPVKLTHKMDLGHGWVLWTENETPPFGWTHAICYTEGKGDIDIMEWHKIGGSSRPIIETSGWSWAAHIREGRAASFEYNGKKYVGIAYLVPA